MSMDNSLRQKASLVRHRNVLSRAERVVELQKNERWSADDSPLGLPKVGHRKIQAAKKAKKTDEAAAATTAAAPAAAAGKAAPAGKAAAAAKPAAGGKAPAKK